MNIVFFVLVAAAVAVAGWRQLALPQGVVEGTPLESLGAALMASAGQAVTLGISLIGAMALFLGIMKVVEAGGLMAVLARLLKPVLHRLFPEVPADHPAMGAMVMNVAANVLGLSNAATPFGVRAVRGLDALNPRKGTASDAMVLFLALNTANVTILPTHVMALRTAVGSHDPAAVIATTLFATLGATGFAILFAKLGRRWFPLAEPAAKAEPAADGAATPLWLSLAALAAALSLLPVMLLWGRPLSPWILPLMVAGALGYGLMRRVAIYEAFVKGAREGLLVSFRILPYLVAILTAVGMLKDSGAMDMLTAPLGRLTTPLGVPPEALTMALLRSLSGSASFGYLASLLKDPAIGPDGYVGMLASTIYGSSETTFYVLAVYFGAAGVKRIRHALLAGLAADLGGLVFSVVICRGLYA